MTTFKTDRLDRSIPADRRIRWNCGLNPFFYFFVRMADIPRQKQLNILFLLLYC